MHYLLAVSFSALTALSLLGGRVEASSSSSDSSDKYPLGVIRTYVQYLNSSDPTNGLPYILDPGHVKMLALGAPNNIYNAYDAYELDQNSFRNTYETLGLNFNPVTNPSVIYDPIVGTWTIPGIAEMVSLSIGNNGLYNVLYDSKTDRDNSGKWTVRSNTNVVVFFVNGTVPIGFTAAGQTYVAGGIFLGWELNLHLKGEEKNWYKPKNHEQFIGYGVRPGQQPISSYGTTDQHIPQMYVTSDGLLGFGSDNVYTGPDAQTLISQHVVNFTTGLNPGY